MHVVFRGSFVKRSLPLKVNQHYSTDGRVMIGQTFYGLERTLSTCQMKRCASVGGLQIKMA